MQNSLFSTVRYIMVQYRTVQCSTVQYSEVLYCSKIVYSTYHGTAKFA